MDQLCSLYGILIGDSEPGEEELFAGARGKDTPLQLVGGDWEKGEIHVS